ncbi:LD-carboxypeptidase [Actinomadura craniellae]|uniref:LD-carboxypeptidase n=1 Tax=Actinomadura craniellae TaxID=2231787 RepID=A0A365H6P1_9ACTN|nr:LD-carboxypeptidase [Actinomadura craniellae]RAY13933.1 LD-carboxypeptidase [Actinomadura craniellae]
MSGGARHAAGEGPRGPDEPAGRGTRPVRPRPGDRVAVVAPSGPVDPDRLETGCTLLRDLGFEVALGEHVFDRAGLDDVPADQGRLAGADTDRAADLRAAWCDPEIRAVVCARGGYGATRVLAHLDWAALAAAEPKILHGSSDITALHAAFGTRLGVTTSFGPMVATPFAADDPERARAALAAALLGGSGPLRGTRAIRSGRARGPLTGGTLSLLTALLGTPYAPAPATGAIAVLEDVGEAPYRVDRMLVQLLQAGWFDGVAGVALGTWSGCGDQAELDAVLAARLGGLGVPVLAGLPVGHGSRQSTVELGAPAELDAGAGTLTPGGAG